MRNTGVVHSKSGVLDHLHRLTADLSLDPKAAFLSRSPPHTALIPDDPARDESVGAKWDHLQYFEDKPWGSGGGGHSQGQDSSCSSLTSSSTTSSLKEQRAGMAAATGIDAAKDRLDRMRRAGWRRFKKQFAIGSSSSSKRYEANTNGYGDFGGVSTAPGGEEVKPAPSSSIGVIPRIRSSRSMQNLDKITRDGFYNLRDATSNMKQKYHSRLELRQAKPRNDYSEFMDEEGDLDEHEIRRQTLAMVGLC